MFLPNPLYPRGLSAAEHPGGAAAPCGAQRVTRSSRGVATGTRRESLPSHEPPAWRRDNCPQQTPLMPGAGWLHCPDTGKRGPLQSVPFLPSCSEPPDLQGLHHSAREPPFPTPSACPQPSQRKTSCAGPEPRTRGQQSTSLQGPLPLCCSPQLKHLESS